MLSQEQIGNFFILATAIDEQQAIVTHIQQKTTEINQAIAQTEKEIKLMQEYRQSLISEVVTGKVRVTHA